MLALNEGGGWSGQGKRSLLHRARPGEKSMDNIAVELFVLGFGCTDDPEEGTGSVDVGRGRWLVGPREEVVAASSTSWREE